MHHNVTINQPRLVAQLHRHEDARRFAYTCPAGHLTIAVGRNIDANGGIGLSDDEIDYLLNNDIQRCHDELAGAYGAWYPALNPARQHAMINLNFNLGLTRLGGFTKFLAAMGAGNWQTAGNELLDSRYARQVGARAQELAQMIRTGEFQD